MRSYAAAAGTFALMLGLSAIVLRLFGTLGKHGDYVLEAADAIRRAADGDLLSLYDGHIPPLMWPLALVVRVPFVVIGQLLGISAADIYGEVGPRDQLVQTQFALGSVGTLALTGTLVALAVAYVMAGRRGLGRWAFAFACGGLVAWNPMSLNAVAWGHPEEVLMAGLLACGVVLLARGRWLSGAVAVGLAVATKQPALLVVPALFFMVPVGRRLKATAVGAAAAAVVTVPFIVTSLGAFVSQNHSATQTSASYQPLSPQSLWYPSGTLLEEASAYSHLIIAVAVIAVTLLVAWRHQWQLPAEAGAALVVVVMGIRCWGDSYNIAYYTTALVVAIASLEIVRGSSASLWRAFPWWSLGAAVAFWQLSSAGWLGGVIADLSASTVPSLLFLLIEMIATGAALRLAVHRARDDEASNPGQALMRPLTYIVVLPVCALLLLTAIGSAYPLPARVPAPPGFRAVTLEVLALNPEVNWWVGPSPMPGELAVGAAVPMPLAADTERRASVQYQQLGVPAGSRVPGTISVFSSLRQRDRTETQAEVARCGSGDCPQGSRVLRTRAGVGILGGSDRNWTYRVIAPDGAVVLVYGTEAGRPEDVLRELRPVTVP